MQYLSVLGHFCGFGDFCFFIFLYLYQSTGMMFTVFANDPEDQGSVQGRVIPKTKKKKNGT